MIADGGEDVTVLIAPLALLDFQTQLLGAPLEHPHRLLGHLGRRSRRQGHGRGREVRFDGGEEDESHQTAAHGSHRQQQQGEPDGHREIAPAQRPLEQRAVEPVDHRPQSSGEPGLEHAPRARPGRVRPTWACRRG